jgi:hypothetical protein
MSYFLFLWMFCLHTGIVISGIIYMRDLVLVINTSAICTTRIFFYLQICNTALLEKDNIRFSKIVCIYIYIYVCVCVCVWACARACARACVHVRVRACVWEREREQEQKLFLLFIRDVLSLFIHSTCCVLHIYNAHLHVADSARQDPW